MSPAKATPAATPECHPPRLRQRPGIDLDVDEPEDSPHQRPQSLA